MLDARSNYGGSLLVLNQLLRHLYGEVLMNQMQRCTINHFATNKVLLQQYYDEILLPVISDAETHSHTKKLYKNVYRLMKRY